jgi:YVTN family beta-propeller protein
MNRIPTALRRAAHTCAIAIVVTQLTHCLGEADKTTTLPNGRRITPAGQSVQLAPFPFAMALSPDGRQVVAPSIGWPFSLNIIDTAFAESSKQSVHRIPAGNKSDPAVQVHTGVAYSPDGKLLYDATGDSGAVDILSTANWQKVGRIALAKDAFAASLVLSTNGKLLYVVDQGNWQIAVIDTTTRTVVATIPTGVNPMTATLSPDGARLYIANSGLFEYKLIAKANGAKPGDQQEGLHFPPTGYPSRAAREGRIAEGYQVAGLGDENDPRGSSLWTYDLANPREPKLIEKLRLGAKITEKPKDVVGGASPSGIVAGQQHVYVSLAHEDAVAVVSADGSRLESEIELSPFTNPDFRDKQQRLLRGVGPLGMAIAGRHLFVAESGINSVAVIDTFSAKVLGHIPTAWYPAAVVASHDEKQLYILSNKGEGTGPNYIHGARHYIGELEYGSLATVPLQNLAEQLPAYTSAVIDNNLAAASKQAPLPATAIRHVFLIIRENRTYDEVLGDLPGADGDPKLARFGMHGWAAENPALHDLHVTPNAHALATQFGTSDRYATDSDVSADGHRWAVDIAPTPWMNIAWTSNYGGRRTGNATSTAPGRRALSGGADAPMPEDEPEFGSLWEHVADAPLPVLNYGEGLEVEGGDERDGTEPEGQRLYLNSPVPKPIFESSDRLFPTFNLGIADQLRFNEFKTDFQKRLDAGPAPALTVIRLPDDHTASPRPADGYPYKASYVADNDLALGKIVDFLSHTSIWKQSAIFVIEDDAQDGADHVDAHRSPLLVISPYARRGFVSHTRTSMTGMHKTIYALLGVGPLNLEDGLAAGLGDMFTSTPDFTPFNFVPSDLRVFDPAKAKIARPKNAKQARELLDCDDPDEIEPAFHRRSRGD